MLLLVDKPTGITSYDVIRRLKKKFPGQKIWHSGTLDPLATGLMLVWVGKGTKELHFLQWLPKSYDATLSFALDTDTWDIDHRDFIKEYPVVTQTTWVLGIIKDDAFCPAPQVEHLSSLMDSLIPSSVLPLPPFSAKKKNWQKLYDLARKGKAVEETKEMFVSAYRLISYDFPFLSFSVSVGAGCYIRSIAHWLWVSCWLGWSLTALRRTSIGDYHVDSAQKLEDIVV